MVLSMLMSTSSESNNEILLTRTSFNKASGSGKSLGTFLFPTGRPSNHSTTAFRPSSSNLDRWTGLTLRMTVLPGFPGNPTFSHMSTFSLESSFRTGDVPMLHVLLVPAEITSSSQTMHRDTSTSRLLSSPVRYLLSESVPSVAGLNLHRNDTHNTLNHYKNYTTTTPV